MIMFDDVTDVNRQTPSRTRTNQSFSIAEREKLLRSHSLNMPRLEKNPTTSSHYGTPRRKEHPDPSDNNVEMVNVNPMSENLLPPLMPSSDANIADTEEILPDDPHVPESDSPNATYIPRVMRFDSLTNTTKLGENGDLPTKAAKVETPKSQYFKDGKRLIDYVLAFEEDEDDDEGSELDDDESSHSNSTAPSDRKTTIGLAEAGMLTKVLDQTQEISTKKIPKKFKKLDKRAIFEGNLKRLGLELEYASARLSKTKFVLIHAPFNVLTKQAELMRIKMPVHQNDIKKNATLMDGLLNTFLQRFKFLDFNEEMKKRTEMQDYFTQPFMEQHLDCFINHEDEENFFPRIERSRMVYDFLIRTRYDRGRSTKFRVGIQRLLYNRAYTAAFPLHEEFDKHAKNVDLQTCSDRQFLFEKWARLRNFYKYQPLHLIQKYFGTQIGFYFSWLGYYTRFLYIISMIGIMCTVYGVVTLWTDYPSKEICDNRDLGGQIIMCPICDRYCDFTYLNSSCTYSRITYVFDNWATIFFAGLMSIWATLFLEGWKRYHAEIAYKWNVFDLESEKEVMRPEFQFRVKKRRRNPVTQETEPYVPFFEKCMRFVGSFVSVLFFVCLVIALAIGIIAYRVIIRSVFFDTDHSDNEKWIQWKVIILTSTTAASINLVFILIMNYFYNWLAYKLTDWECPRTQREFDNSFTLKVFAFQFVNYYSSLFYIAFFKGRFVGVPGLGDLHEVTIQGQRLEQCDPAGCMVELVIQLFIIMGGKQFFNAFMEIGYPICWGWIRKWKLNLPETRKQMRERLRKERLDAISSNPNTIAQYEHDYAKNPVSEMFLFDEYLEMVIQFGFVTLFVAAFPLAPFCALVNNIFEIRLDAKKFIIHTQRPMPAQSKGIGIWLKILDIMSNLAVLCNAFVIAFTSDFIPKLYYIYMKGTILGYVEYSLSYYDARNLTFNRPHMANVSVCRYRDYRKVPCSLKEVIGVLNLFDCNDNYEYSLDFWVILAFRLGFVLFFEHLVLLIKAVFANIIPDVPTKIVLQLQRERYLARQAVLQRQGNILSTRKKSVSPTKDEHDLGKVQINESDDEDDDATFEVGKMGDGQDPVPSRQLSQILTRSNDRILSDTQGPKSAPPIMKPRFRGALMSDIVPVDVVGLRKSAPPIPRQYTEEKLSDSLESFQSAPSNFDSNEKNEKKHNEKMDIFYDKHDV